MNLPRQFMRYAVVGASGTLVQWGVLWAGVRYFAAPAAVASSIGYVLGSLLNYLLHYFVTFGSGKPHAEAASKYYSVLGVGWCINAGLMGLLVHHWHLNYWFAQFLATGVGVLWNFAGSRWWAFKHPAAKAE